MCGSDPRLSARWSSSSGAVRVSLSGAHKGQLLPWLRTHLRAADSSEPYLASHSRRGRGLARVPRVRMRRAVVPEPWPPLPCPGSGRRGRSGVSLACSQKAWAPPTWGAASAAHCYALHRRFLRRVPRLTSAVPMAILGDRPSGLDGPIPKFAPGMERRGARHRGMRRAGVQVGVAEVHCRSTLEETRTLELAGASALRRNAG